jgi:2-polyprenyl-3-methyl-5-hydroxy-6-metoxy-1,4-benzoquinol methylase
MHNNPYQERLTMRDYNKECSIFNINDPEKKYEYSFDKLLRRYMLRSFLPFLSSGKALELGCFQGEFTEMLIDHFADITVVEAADTLVEYVRNRVGYRVKFINSVFETVELQDKYDAIFLIHTLEHLDDPVFILRKINSWLSDQGLLFLAVPNANAPSRQIAVKMGLISHNTAVTEAEFAHGHRKTYAFDSLEKDTIDAGLNIVHRGGIFFKALANFQFDKLLNTDIISDSYLEACYKLGMQYPDLCASIFLVCKKGLI